MYNYKKNRKRYQSDDLGSLYIDESKLNNQEQPIIYIGGQMEHRLHVLEQSGYTLDAGTTMFTGTWAYEYPITTTYKSEYNGRNFARSLISSIEEANLEDVILLTESYGGTIASYATKSDRIHSVIAIHPAITGTPLASPSYMQRFKPIFTKKQNDLLEVASYIVDEDFGFQKENHNGILFHLVDLNKLLVVGSSINQQTEQNPLMKETADMIEKITGTQSDGITRFNTDELDRLGINYLVEDENVNHLQAATKEHIAKVYQKTIRR